MTDTPITPTRRAVIAGLGLMVAAPAGAAVAPLVCAPVEQIATDARAWNDAMAHYRKTVADGEAFDRKCLGPHFDAARARFGDDRPKKGAPDWPEYRDWCESSGFDAAMDQWQIVGEAEGDAQTTLLAMPAPDMAALRWKLEHTFETDGDIALWCPEIALAIRADFLRLLPAEA